MKKILLKFIFAFVFIFSILCFSSCTTELPPENYSEEAPPHIEEDDGLLHIARDGYSEFNITYSERADSDTIAIAEDLRDRIFAKTGVELQVKSDYVSRVEDISEEIPEILIGLTNRKSSVEFNKKIDILRFAVKITDTKVVIIGKSIEAIALGVNFFCDKYLGMGASILGNGEWAIEKGTEHIGEPLTDSAQNLMGERMNFIANGERFATIGEKIQGGCISEGHYYSFVRSNEGVETYRIVKFDMKDMSIVNIGSELYTGDGLELEYDASVFGIAILNAYENAKTIQYVNTLGLTPSSAVESKIDIKMATYIGNGAYAAIERQSGDLIFLNESLNETSRYDILLTNVNGVTSDDRFIYLLGEFDGETVIAAYTSGGDLINTINLDLAGKTPTNIEEYNGQFLVGFNTQSGGELYKFKVEVE